MFNRWLHMHAIVVSTMVSSATCLMPAHVSIRNLSVATALLIIHNLKLLRIFCQCDRLAVAIEEVSPGWTRQGLSSLSNLLNPKDRPDTPLPTAQDSHGAAVPGDHPAADRQMTPIATVALYI